MLLSFSFRWSPRCRQHACRPHRVGHLSTKSVRVRKLIYITSARSEASNSGQTACVVLVRPSVCGLTGSLSLMRFVFSSACENPSESTTIRRKDYRSSQAELCLHSCTGSSASRPIQACDLSRTDRRLAEINGLRKSATSQVVFILLPAPVLTRHRRCPECLMCYPFAPLKPTPLCDLKRLQGDTRYILTWEALCQPHKNQRMPAILFHHECCRSVRSLS